MLPGHTRIPGFGGAPVLHSMLEYDPLDDDLYHRLNRERDRNDLDAKASEEEGRDRGA